MSLLCPYSHYWLFSGCVTVSYGKVSPNWLTGNFLLWRSLIFSLWKVETPPGMEYCQIHSEAYSPVTVRFMADGGINAFLENIFLACFCHKLLRTCMNLQLNCQETAVVSCLFVTPNEGLLHRSRRWLDWWRTYLRGRWLLLAMMETTCWNEAFHYAQMRPAQLADHERTRDYWA